jgi:hypothetical protein
MFSLPAGLFARAAPYVMAVLGLAVIGSSVTAYVLSARLETAQETVKRVSGERDTAISANEQLVKDAKRHEDAGRELAQQLVMLRGQYEEAERIILAVQDDGCLDRAVPRSSVDGLLNSAPRDRGSGAAAGPGVARAAPGS